MKKCQYLILHGMMMVTLFTVLLTDCYAQVQTTKYGGNPDNVEKIVYDRLGLLNKNLKGEISRTSDLEWKETGNKGVFDLLEAGRNRSKIYLDDTANNRKLMIDLDAKKIFIKAKIGWTAIALITNIEQHNRIVNKSDVPTSKASTSKNSDDQIHDQPIQTVVNETVEIVAAKSETDIVTQSGNEKADLSLDIPELNKIPVYYAILIAENDYQDEGLKDLPGTVRDMRKIYELLTTKYTFETTNTDTLVNATRRSILEKIYTRANALTENDNLFIFYAGHGQLKKYADGKEEGYLVPSDANKDNPVSFISSSDLIGTIKHSNAKHILFTADACFAGSLFRDLPSDAPLSVAEAYRDKSRRILSSGNRQAVPDESDFIESFRMALLQNKSKYITTEHVVDSFKDQYRSTTHMQLQYYPILYVDDRGGEFVFVKR